MDRVELLLDDAHDQLPQSACDDLWNPHFPLSVDPPLTLTSSDMMRLLVQQRPPLGSDLEHEQISATVSARFIVRLD
jgi:hypothetical protein